MPALTAAPTEPARSRLPSTVTVPLDGLRAPYTASRISDRPDPTSPARPTISPAATSKLTSANTLFTLRSETDKHGLGRRVGLGAVGEDVLDVATGHQPDELGGGGGLGGQVGRHGATVLQHRHPVADLADLLEAVGDVHHRDALGGQVTDHPEEGLDLLLVERGRRLVHHDQPGVVGERPRHADDLLARGGQRADLAVGADLRVTEPGQQEPGGLAGLGALDQPAARLLVPQEDVLGHGQARRPGRAPGRSSRSRG